jgi:membrane protease YdiL (CAAX protease family)
LATESLIIFPLKRFLQSEAGAAVLWALMALLLGASISPWLYQSGKSLAAHAASADLIAPLEWLGSACQRAKFSRFFSRSLVVSAVTLMPPLLWRIRMIRKSRGEIAAVSFRLPWQSGLIQFTLGCAIAGGVLYGIAVVLQHLGAYAPADHPPTFGRILKKVLVPALAASVLEEWLFRSVLLGLWLKFTKPLTACIGTSLIFASVHFLQPSNGVVIANPASTLAGFELLVKILSRFTNPQVFLADFFTIFTIGMMLALARFRTGALWFPIGLHAGWIIAFKGFGIFHQAVENNPLESWGIGDTIRSGVSPLLILGITAILCHYVLRRFDIKSLVDQPRITVMTKTF